MLFYFILYFSQETEIGLQTVIRFLLINTVKAGFCLNIFCYENVLEFNSIPNPPFSSFLHFLNSSFSSYFFHSRHLAFNDIMKKAISYLI